MVAIKMQYSLFSVLLFNILYSLTSALYFHIGETEKKCFIEEIPDETMITGNYHTQLYDKRKEEYLPDTQGLGMFVEVKDPDEKVILSRQYGSEGRFMFTSRTPGEHQICLHSNSSKFALFAGGMLRVHLDIQVGEHTNNYAEIAAKDKLTELQLRVRQLVEQVDQIQKEQNYQRYREEHFRQTSESTNQRVLWWSIVQTLILVAIGFWQMRHLKSFCEAKKLQSFPCISAMVNNGTLSYDHGKDGRLSELGGCLAEIRNKDHDTYLAIRCSKGRLTVMVDIDDKNEWKECIDIGGVRLPTGYYFGASSATGDLSDNYDIISMKLYQLMVVHTPEEDNMDWTRIEPSVSLLKSPEGAKQNSTSTGDGTEERYATTLMIQRAILQHSSHWLEGLPLLCALLGIVVCAVVGAVVFQKRQERNKILLEESFRDPN
ncbi:hypothetical protein GJAV_G00199510 [Gymnothorax javanicus]|nr:hypothetical protein GJAV_G00199510 [Gymnothorax javanicus]